MGPNVKSLVEEIARLQKDEHLIDINAYRSGDETATQEEVAGGVLKLMQSEAVSDPEMF